MEMVLRSSLFLQNGTALPLRELLKTTLFMGETQVPDI